MKRSRAFSLVELLVSIAIIAVLIALAVPSLRRARQAGQQAKCTSNLRQMGLAMHAYAGDNDDTASALSDWRGVAPNIGSRTQMYVWTGRYRLYASDSYEVFNCPAAIEMTRWRYRPDPQGLFAPHTPTFYGYKEGEMPVVRSGEMFPRGSPELYFSYGYNAQGTHGAARFWGQQYNPRDLGIQTLGLGVIDHSLAPRYAVLTPNWDGQRLSSLVRPEEFIAFADSSPEGMADAEVGPWNHSVQGYDQVVSTRHGGGRPDMTYEFSRNPVGGQSRVYTESRKVSGGSVVGFGDGHAAYMGFRQLHPFDRSRTPEHIGVVRRWNRDFDPHVEVWVWQ